MTVWLAADLILIAVVAGFVYFSMKKGLVKSSFGGIANLVVIALVFSFHVPFQGYIENSVIGDTVREKIRTKIETSVYSNPDINNTEDKAESVDKLTEGLKLPKFMGTWISESLKTKNESIDSIKNNLIDSVTDMTFPIAMQFISIIFLYIILRLALLVIFLALKMIVEVPVIGTFDKLLGAAAGGINAIFVIYIAAAAIMLFTPAKSMSSLEAGINSTFIFKYFYYNNLLTNLFF